MLIEFLKLEELPDKVIDAFEDLLDDEFFDDEQKFLLYDIKEYKKEDLDDDLWVCIVTINKYLKSLKVEQAIIEI